MEPFDTFITDMTHKAFKLASTSLHKQKQRPHFSKSYFAILVIDMWLKRSKPKKHIFLWIITNWGSPGWPQCSVAWRDTLLLLWPVWRVLVARVWRVTCDKVHIAPSQAGHCAQCLQSPVDLQTKVPEDNEKISRRPSPGWKRHVYCFCFVS